MTYTDEQLDAVLEALFETDATPEQASNLAADLRREYDGMLQTKAEAAWEHYQDADRSGADATYRAAMIDAGRGHLLK